MSKDTELTKEQILEKLTNKQRIFCHQYIIDWNGARAAREAGYSADTAKEIAAENLTKPNISRYIDMIKDDIEKEAGISKLMVINRLKQFAFTDIDAFFEDWITREDFQLLTREAKACIQEVESKVLKKNIGTKEDPDIVDVEYVKVKLVDKKGALQDLAKMMGWNEAEKLNVGFSNKIKGITFED